MCKGEKDLNDRAAPLSAIQCDIATAGTDELSADRKTDTRSLHLGSKERIVDLIKVFRVDSVTSVPYIDVKEPLFRAGNLYCDLQDPCHQHFLSRS